MSLLMSVKPHKMGALIHIKNESKSVSFRMRISAKALGELHAEVSKLFGVQMPVPVLAQTSVGGRKRLLKVLFNVSSFRRFLNGVNNGTYSNTVLPAC